MSVKVLVIDDSALMRKLLTDILGADEGIEVLGAAPDPIKAWPMIQALRPDVLTLDVEMPRMDGLSFLEKLLRAHPMPVVMVSSTTAKGADNTLRALELGAIDFVTKPTVDVERGLMRLARELIAKVKAASRARVRARPGGALPMPPPPPPPSRSAPLQPVSAASAKVIAIGASTGGTEALREVLCALPAGSPGIVVVQHMPEGFTAQFAARLDRSANVRVKEAEDGDFIAPGRVLIAPGSNQHMEVVRTGMGYGVKLVPSPPVKHHRPSVSVMFHSVARVLGDKAVGVILTGMGDDGADGMLAMRMRGARTIAQDEARCVVFGMPKAAIAQGGAETVLPLDRIAGAMLQLASGQVPATASRM